jgi:biopolymer transport protein ExbD
MSKNFFNEEELDNPEINLTPLIDVVFVILIMFIVVVPLLEVDRVELVSGSPQLKHESAVTEGVSLHVYGDNSLVLNGKILALEELPMRLTIEKQKTTAKQLTLFHDKHASFGTYQTIKQIAESIGFEELDVILKPE